VVIARDNLVRCEDVCIVLKNEATFNKIPEFEPEEEHVSEEACVSFKSEVSILEKTRILKAMEMCNGNKVKAAQYLGWSRTTLWRKLKEMEARG
ncbi:MAG: Bacterial regulatory protein Fis family, partial [Clostridiales bacterium]|nr:Bacterial regulatory protein Fis family [Clostridiales bacterium]